MASAKALSFSVLFPAGFLYPLPERVELGEQGARAVVQRAAGSGQREAAAVALAERHAQLPLQRGDRPGDGGMAFIQAPRRGGEAPRLGEHGKVAQLFELHLQNLKMPGISSESL